MNRETRNAIPDRRREIALFLAFGLSGAAALIYEVTWTRALSVVIGSTTYALSTMLATFMAGLAVGGYVGGRFADGKKDLGLLFGLCEAGIGILGLLSIPAIYALPPIYLSVYQTLHFNLALFLSGQFVLCALIMILPTSLMGMTFPLVSKLAVGAPADLGKKIGAVYAANTAGAILGALFGGFVLIPKLGIKMTAMTAAGLNLFVAVVMILYFFSGNGKKAILVIAGLFIAAAGAEATVEEGPPPFATFYAADRMPALDTPLSFAFTNRKFVSEQSMGKLLFYTERPEGAVRLYRNPDGLLILQTGGKIEGTSKADMPNALLLAYLPLAAHREARSCLVIGLGSGVTLHAVKDYLTDVHLVEINSGVVQAIRTFGPSGLLDGIEIHHDDARNLLFSSERKYDIIISEPSYPTESSIANLFTREYYDIAKKRLNPGGMYSQWLPYYMLKDSDMEMMFKTFGAAFRYIYLFKVGNGGDRIMLGADTPFALDGVSMVSNAKALNRTPYDLPAVVSRDPVQIAALAASPGSAMNTDDNQLLEFNVVRNLITGVKR